MPKLPTIEKRPNVSTDWNNSNGTDISDTVTYGTIEESIDSIDKLLKSRRRSMREIIEETGMPESKAVTAVRVMCETGKAIFTGFREHKGIDEGQLSLFK
jgi:hypothetical protein